jgi:hypothetical protein
MFFLLSSFLSSVLPPSTTGQSFFLFLYPSFFLPFCPSSFHVPPIPSFLPYFFFLIFCHFPFSLVAYSHTKTPVRPLSDFFLPSFCVCQTLTIARAKVLLISCHFGTRSSPSLVLLEYSRLCLPTCLHCQHFSVHFYHNNALKAVEQ